MKTSKIDKKFKNFKKDNPKTPFIARVDRFFEDTKKEADTKRVMVDWYLRQEDCAQIARGQNREAESDEVFLYTGKFPKN